MQKTESWNQKAKLEWHNTKQLKSNWKDNQPLFLTPAKGHDWSGCKIDTKWWFSLITMDFFLTFFLKRSPQHEFDSSTIRFGNKCSGNIFIDPGLSWIPSFLKMCSLVKLHRLLSNFPNKKPSNPTCKLPKLKFGSAGCHIQH